MSTRFLGVRRTMTPNQIVALNVAKARALRGWTQEQAAPAEDAGLAAPDAGMKGLDPIVLLDAILGRPDNLEHWERELDAYASSVAPAPRSKREKPSVFPADLADRLHPLGLSRARALLRQAFGDITAAGDVLERLAEALRVLDEAAQDDTDGQHRAAGAGTRRRSK